MQTPVDQGARFRKCDFQVHTLRDARWIGPFHPVDDRKAFAEALIADCRRKNLHSIAITDHHDLCLYKSVKLAAENELIYQDDSNSGKEKIIVFPGIELTLATPPCQAILIFDPDLSEITFPLIFGILRLHPTADENEKTTQTIPLHTDLTLSEISISLNTLRTNPEETNPSKHETLAGRFILLPNVKKGGHKSVYRDGFHSHYTAMPCVGGYIEGVFYDELDEGNRAKIEGKVLQWGKRSLGVFQTSDCRKAEQVIENGNSFVSFPKLGAWPTWVKWAEPSSEALRQACLAPKSRISHVEPNLPALQIGGVIVSDSRFLGYVELGLNPQFNAFIGGRGTGKSSLLEYIRWALCDDPLATDHNNELPNFQSRRKTLVDGTLRPLQAKVTVFYRKNEVTYQIERDANDKSGNVKITNPSGATELMSFAQVRSAFPVVSYAQKQLSCVGTLPEEINRLITTPIYDKISAIQRNINDEILPKLKNQRSKELRLAHVNKIITEIETNIKSQKEQVQSLQDHLNALTPAQQKVIQAHEPLTNQNQWLTRAETLPLTISTILEEAIHQISALGELNFPAEAQDQFGLSAILENVNNFSKNIRAQLSNYIKNAQNKSWVDDAINENINQFRRSYTEHLSEYEQCLSANAKNQRQLHEIQTINKNILDNETNRDLLNIERSNLQSFLETIGDLNWRNYLSEVTFRGQLLKDQCQIVNEQAQHEFKAEVGFCTGVKPIEERMIRVTQGRNIKESEVKIEELCRIIRTAENPVEKWSEVMCELDSLYESRGSSTPCDLIILRQSGFTEINLSNIRAGLNQELLEQIRYLNLDDQIIFKFRVGKTSIESANYIPFDDASPGQQATCLLRTLLSQSGSPLLIDQPEEDLDNEQIQILSDRMAETKHNRQLIFVSHNANIVVNGDAELVVCFGYRDQSDNSSGKIVYAGSIDCKPIRDRITTVMEGGKEAFDLRKNKYGF